MGESSTVIGSMIMPGGQGSGARGVGDGIELHMWNPGTDANNVGLFEGDNA